MIVNMHASKIVQWLERGQDLIAHKMRLFFFLYKAGDLYYRQGQFIVYY